MTYYHRYRLDDGRYWGSTDVQGDDAECGYTEVDPATLTYDFMTQTPVWKGDHWEIRDLVNGV